MALKGVLASSVLPVTATEVKDVFTKSFTKWAPGRPRRIALAISGGSDSMALAYLCRQLISEKLIPDLRVKAFIVDHRARKESTDEAHKVAGWIKDLGFESDILTLKWPSGTDPSSLTRFETLARQLRYQALGRACVSNNLQALFLGHHLDDNLETALLRIAMGHGRPGLTGFDVLAPIPECDGIYGVSRSGSTMTFQNLHRDTPAGVGSFSANPNSVSNLPLLPDQQLHISTGGVSLYRPFRSIPKSRLLATCTKAGIPFVTDLTNFDPTLTARNVARCLLSSRDLPQALQPESLSLLVQKSREAELEEKKSSDMILEHCKIVCFDLRSGSLVVQFPSPQELRSIVSPTKGPVGEDVNIQAVVLQRLNDLVCPISDKRASFESRFAAAPVVFVEHGSTPGHSKHSLPPEGFTLGNVMWTPVRPTEKKTEPAFPGDFTQRSQATLAMNPQDPQPNLWLLSRRIPPRTTNPPVTKFQLNMPGFSGNERVITKWTDWQLWDGRYWVRVRAVRALNGQDTNNASSVHKTEYFPATTVPITMRLLGDSDLRLIEKDLKGTKSKIRMHRSKKFAPGVATRHWMQPISLFQFKEALHRISKGKMRFTLPVLTAPKYKAAPSAESSETQAGKEEIYAFPSINAVLPKTLCVQHPSNAPSASGPSGEDENDAITELSGPISHWNLKWNIMYREIDPEVIRLTGYKRPEPLPVQQQRKAKPRSQRTKYRYQRRQE
ncbi:hypothetical protein VTO42DRAFT_8925 [Malbranchea cinnamomea]